MKKFDFPLETVLGYKRQLLDSLLGELGAAQALTRQQEAVLEQARSHYLQQQEDFAEKSRQGISVPEALMYENGLRSLELELEREARKLEKLRVQEEAARERVVEAKKETRSLEKLKDKKLDGYNKTARKQEEAMVEEFVTTTMIIAAQA